MLWRVGVHLAGVLQFSVLGQILLNTFINDLSTRVERTISKFGDDTKLGSVVDCIEGQEALKMDISRLEF